MRSEDEGLSYAEKRRGCLLLAAAFVVPALHLVAAWLVIDKVLWLYGTALRFAAYLFFGFIAAAAEFVFFIVLTVRSFTGGARRAEDPARRAQWAAARGDGDVLRRALDAEPGLVNAAFFRGRTLLHIAARAGSHEAVALLLARGAEPSAEDRAYRTPVELAEAAGHAGIAELIRSRRVGGVPREPAEADGEGGPDGGDG